MKSALFLLSGLLCTTATLPADPVRPDSSPRCKCGCGCMVACDCSCTHHQRCDCPPSKKH